MMASATPPSHPGMTPPSHPAMTPPRRDVSPSMLNVPITHDTVAELREAFTLIDQDLDDFITKEELLTLMGSIGPAPTQEEVERLIQEADLDANGTIDFSEFLRLMVRGRNLIDRRGDNAAAPCCGGGAGSPKRAVLNDMNTKELESAFSNDGSEAAASGWMPMTAFVELLTQYGDPFSKEEMDELLKSGVLEIRDDGKSQRVNYRAFVRILQQPV